MAAFGTVHSPLAVLALPGRHPDRAVLLRRSSRRSPRPRRTTRASPPSRGWASSRSSSSRRPSSRSASCPGWMHPLAYATPLYHGVDLCRMLVLGRVDWASAGWDVVYLVALTAVGVLLAAAPLPPAVGGVTGVRDRGHGAGRPRPAGAVGPPGHPARPPRARAGEARLPAQRRRLPPGLAVPRLGVLRAVLLPGLDRARAEQAGRRRSTWPATSSPTRCSWPRASWPRRR